MILEGKNFPSIVDLMDRLSVKRPVFHSEADFQFAFAWELQTLCPEATIYLERPIHTHAGNMYIDILAKIGDATLAIELKYKPCQLQMTSGQESFSLKDQRANDFGRYDFIKDISRLEYFSQHFPNFIGWAIMVTNDANYWQEQQRSNTADIAFKIAEGRTIAKKLAWPEGYRLEARRKREMPLDLNGVYSLAWRNYSDLPGIKNGRIRYLPVTINSLVLTETHAAIAAVVNFAAPTPELTVLPTRDGELVSRLPLKTQLLHLMRDGYLRNASEWATLLRHGKTQTQQLIRDLIVDGHTVGKLKRGQTMYYRLEKEL